MLETFIDAIEANHPTGRGRPARIYYLVRKYREYVEQLAAQRDAA
jgi:hypothetical protein